MDNIRSGVTVAELALTLTLIGVLAATSVPRAAAVVDRLSVQGASQDVVLGLSSARNAAVRRGDYASFVVDPATGRVRVVSRGATLWERDLARTRGVRIEVTRDSVTFAPTGVGWGAANTSIVVARGGRADTVVTSRLGRVRH